MANVIKYNTGSVPANAIKSGNFDIGVNFGGYGSTSATNYYNGRTPNVSGYTIYQANGVSSPILYAAANDAELIGLSNQLGGSGNTTIGQALTFFKSSSTLTCVNVDTSNIVTRGLVLNLDAGFTPSYPKTGTSWSDISGSGNTGTLFNSPTYTGDSGGCFLFDGTNDYMSVPSLSNTSFPQTAGTISFWYYVDTTGVGGFTTTIFDRSVADGRNHLAIWWDFQGSSFGLAAFYSTGSSPFNFTFGGVANAWNHVVMSYTTSPGFLSYYVNGSGNSGTPSYAGWNPSGQFVGFGSPTTFPTKGKSFNLMIYNRVLSQTEVLQNYYAGCQRLIPTDNLVLWLDGNNTNKQVMTASTANDISGNNKNGTLTNGVALSRDGQRSFSFDGIDDIILTSVNTLASSTTWTVWVNRTQSMNYYNMIMGMYLPYFAMRADGNIMFSNNIGGTQRTISSFQNLTNNGWYHITFISSYTAPNTIMSIYINGIFVVDGTFAGQQPTTTNDSLRLGGWETGGTYPFNGKIGDVRLYNRALTSTEISYIYLAGVPRYGNRVFQNYLILACGYGSIDVYSTSFEITNYNFTVGMYLYTNPGLTIPLVTSTLSVDYVVSPTIGECPLSNYGIETNSAGLILTVTGNSFQCPGCGC